ncbi:MAG: tetratricopeptide repeat protein [Candidatus Omnitrophica bacterium]|nr:tetratricopeptide repeat protein [Candidatus Omnitrophota bacterium]
MNSKRFPFLIIAVFLLCGCVSTNEYAKCKVADAYTHYTLGLLYDNENDIQQAIGEYEKALIHDPHSSSLHLRLAIDYIQEEEYNKAIEQLCLVLKSNPKDIHSYFLLAVLYTSQKKFEQAGKQYRQIIKLKPKNWTALVGLSNIYVTQEKMALVIPLYEKMILLAKDNAPLIFYNLGLAYLKTAELNLAIENLRKAVEFSPENSQFRTVLALTYELNEQKDKSIAEYERILQLNPLDQKICRHLGDLFLQQKKVDKAIEQYHLLLKLNPRDSQTYFYLGSAYLQLEKNSQALKNFELALQFAEEKPLQGEHLVGSKKKSIYYFYLGVVYDKIGEKKKAEQSFKEAIILDADNKDACNYLGYSYAEQGVNLDEAERLIKRAIKNEPRQGAYIDSLGWVYYKKSLKLKGNKSKEMLRKALKEVKKSLGLMDDNAIVREHLGDIYFEKGSFKKAEGEWQKALQIDSQNEKLKEKLRHLKGAEQN